MIWKRLMHLNVFFSIILIAGEINAAVFEDRRSRLTFKGPRGPSAFYVFPDQEEYLVEDEALTKNVLLPAAATHNYKRSGTPSTARLNQPLYKQQRPSFGGNKRYDVTLANKNKFETSSISHSKTVNFKKSGSQANTIYSSRYSKPASLIRENLYRRYVQKQLKHPMKLFHHVISVLKKRSAHSQLIPPSYYLLPYSVFKTSRNNVKKSYRDGKRHTDIDTKKFHISIDEKKAVPHNLQEHANIKSKLHTKNVRKPNNFQENANRRSELHSKKLGDLNNHHKKKIENQILSLVLEKLRKQRAKTLLNNRGKINNNKSQSVGSYILDAYEKKKNDSKDIIASIHNKQAKKKRLTSLFVRFMEDLTDKLDLDSLAIADMLVRHASSKQTEVNL